MDGRRAGDSAHEYPPIVRARLSDPRAAASISTTRCASGCRRGGRSCAAQRVSTNTWAAPVVYQVVREELQDAAGKDGNLHLLDRGTGQPLSRIPVTIQLNTVAPITPEGTRYLPGNGRRRRRAGP